MRDKPLLFFGVLAMYAFIINRYFVLSMKKCKKIWKHYENSVLIIRGENYDL